MVGKWVPVPIAPSTRCAQDVTMHSWNWDEFLSSYIYMCFTGRCHDEGRTEQWALARGDRKTGGIAELEFDFCFWRFVPD